MGFRNPTVWLILILLIVLLFGASRLPDMTRNLGRSLKIFKEEVRDLSDDKPTSTIEQNPPTPPAPPANPAPEPTSNDDPPNAPQPPTDQG